MEPQAFSPDHQQPEEISLHFTSNSILAKKIIATKSSDHLFSMQYLYKQTVDNQTVNNRMITCEPSG